MAYWAQQPRHHGAITALVEAMRAKATSDPGYLELDVWYDGPYQRAFAAGAAAQARKTSRAAKGVPARLLRPVTALWCGSRGRVAGGASL